MVTFPPPPSRPPLLTALAGAAMIATSVAAAPTPRFEAQTIDDKIRIGYGLAIGDVDGDGLADILLADARYIFWYRNPGEPGALWARNLMAHNLTRRDHVCIAAADIDGDGKVEVAVGAQWDPAETEDAGASGAVFYLVRPDDPAAPWQAVQLEPHDPTTHRMRWVPAGAGSWHLAVLPLHGIGNNPATGGGDPVRLQLLSPPQGEPAGPDTTWTSTFVDTGLNLTHNLDIDHEGRIHAIGRQGQLLLDPAGGGEPGRVEAISGGEIRVHEGGAAAGGLTATIEPFHGHQVVVYRPDTGSEGEEDLRREVLDDSLNQGHALAIADFLKAGRPQVVAGWRNPDQDGKVGLRLYLDEGEKGWATHTIDDNTMAAEDLAVADLDGDGSLDIVASGRATRNVVIYWNRSGEP